MSTAYKLLWYGLRLNDDRQLAHSLQETRNKLTLPDPPGLIFPVEWANLIDEILLARASPQCNTDYYYDPKKAERKIAELLNGVDPKTLN